MQESTARQATVNERDESFHSGRAQFERTGFYEELESRGLGESRVICPFTMYRKLEISEQFKELAGSIGVYNYLDKLRHCKVYKEPTLNFLSTFNFQNGIISFRITGGEHRMNLEHFNSILGFTPNTVFNGNTEGVERTWQNIADCQEGGVRRSNMIRHVLLKYLYRAISSAIFGRGQTNTVVTLEEVKLIHCALHIAGSQREGLLDIGECLAKSIVRTVRNPQATGQLGYGGLVHLLAKHYDENVDHFTIGAKTQLMDEKTLKHMKVLSGGTGTDPLCVLNGGVHTALPLEPIDYQKEDSWSVVRTKDLIGGAEEGNLNNLEPHAVDPEPHAVDPEPHAVDPEPHAGWHYEQPVYAEGWIPWQEMHVVPPQPHAAHQNPEYSQAVGDLTAEISGLLSDMTTGFQYLSTEMRTIADRVNVNREGMKRIKSLITQMHMPPPQPPQE